MEILSTEITPGMKIKKGSRWFTVLESPIPSHHPDQVKIKCQSTIAKIHRRHGYIQRVGGELVAVLYYRKTTMVPVIQN